MFVVAMGVSLIASQSNDLRNVCNNLSVLKSFLFPRFKVIHTSAKYEGQVYIPKNIGHSYGITVVAVMVITTCMVTLIMLVIWKTSIWLIALFFFVFFTIDIIYLSSALFKFNQGGYLPLALSLVLIVIMGTWHYIQMKRYVFELNNKVSSDYVRRLSENLEVKRMPGIGLLYCSRNSTNISTHLVGIVPSILSVIVMVSIKSIPISKIVSKERFLFRQVEPKDYGVFRCVVRYGYKDKIEEHSVFERQLVDSLKEFIKQEKLLQGVPAQPQHVTLKVEHSQEPKKSDASNSSIRGVNEFVYTSHK
ncbi:transporter [Lithospermum erythrorhizon]|uniref:Transporter n=1 Tax=Lithospermum erythrorhizon TaxID=34254 RepID=A0AAV3NHW6_LITER